MSSSSASISTIDVMKIVAKPILKEVVQPLLLKTSLYAGIDGAIGWGTSIGIGTAVSFGAISAPLSFAISLPLHLIVSPLACMKLGIPRSYRNCMILNTLINIISAVVAIIITAHILHMGYGTAFMLGTPLLLGDLLNSLYDYYKKTRIPQEE